MPYLGFVIASSVLLIGALIFLTVVVANRSSDAGDSEAPPTMGDAQSSVPAYERCHERMLPVVEGLAEDQIAGYEFPNGPGAQAAAAEHGMASPFFQAAAVASSDVYLAYLNGGTKSAQLAVAGATVQACESLGF